MIALCLKELLNKKVEKERYEYQLIVVKIRVRINIANRVGNLEQKSDIVF